MDRKPDTVTFVVETTRNTVVDVDAYVAALTLSREAADGDWLTESRATGQMGRAVKQEIPEDRVTPRLVAVDVWAEGEHLALYDDDNPFVVEEDDRVAIVIAAEAAGITIPDTFAAPGRYAPDDKSHQRLFDDQSVS